MILRSHLVLTRSVPVKWTVVVGVDWTWGVAISVSVKRIVSVAGNVDAFGSMAGVVVDGFGEGPAGVDIGDITEGSEDTPWAGVLAVRCP